MLTLNSRVFVLLEVGINMIEVTVNPEILERATEHFWHHAKSKLESRWFSGEWKGELQSNDSIDIQQFLQPLPKAMTKEFELSTRDVNLSLKLSDLKVKIPAPLSIDLRRSSDILISFGEITILVSSTLPRLFLSEKIFEIDGEERVYIEDSESNIRMQTSVKGFSIEALPSPLFHSLKEPREVLYSRALTFLGSYDRLNPDIDCKHFLFLSILLQYVHINIDFDVLGGISTTLLYYTTKYKSTKNEPEFEQSQQLISKVTSQLPETLNLVIRFNLNKIDCRLWKQHVPVSGAEISVVPLIPLFHFDAGWNN